jgi:Na+-transporting methylmalonyl-CoA/oxaloacetate decarboxylase gamma subunit
MTLLFCSILIIILLGIVAAIGKHETRFEKIEADFKKLEAILESTAETIQSIKEAHEKQRTPSFRR